MFVGCANAGGTPDTPGPAEATGGQGNGGSSGAGGAGGGAGAAGNAGAGGGVTIPDGGVEPTSCGDVGKVIFVVSSENVLLSFDPAKQTFSTIGTLNCPAGFGDSPFSMAVDRGGNAYVLYQSGNIYKASTEDASCVPSGYQPNQLGWARFGMGYVSDAAGSDSETLYVIDGTGLGSGGSNKGLGKVSQSGQLAAVGQFDKGLGGRTAEVTGLGDGRLFAFFVDSGKNAYSVAEVEKSSGKILTDEPQPLPEVSAWAFAHWGGSFYLFNSGTTGSSRVHKYTPGKGTQQVVASAGYRIVGAGVSTCAPTTEIIN